MKTLYPSESVKYLGVKIDDNLNWKDQTYDIITKLNRENVLLYKIRNYVTFNTLKAIYFPIFDSHINYANLLWGQNQVHYSKKSNTLKSEDNFLINNIFYSEIHNYDSLVNWQII